MTSDCRCTEKPAAPASVSWKLETRTPRPQSKPPDTANNARTDLLLLPRRLSASSPAQRPQPHARRVQSCRSCQQRSRAPETSPRFVLRGRLHMLPQRRPPVYGKDQATLNDPGLTDWRTHTCMAQYKRRAHHHGQRVLCEGAQDTTHISCDLKHLCRRRCVGRCVGCMPPGMHGVMDHLPNFPTSF